MSKIVEVEVTEHKANGILVKVLEDDNRMGRIRFRELSWDKSVSAVPPMPEVGEEIRAKIIRDKRSARYIDISTREVTDPWKGAEEMYKIGQVVRG